MVDLCGVSYNAWHAAQIDYLLTYLLTYLIFMSSNIVIPFCPKRAKTMSKSGVLARFEQKRQNTLDLRPRSGPVFSGNSVAVILSICLGPLSQSIIFIAMFVLDAKLQCHVSVCLCAMVRCYRCLWIFHRLGPCKFPSGTDEAISCRRAGCRGVWCISN